MGEVSVFVSSYTVKEPRFFRWRASNRAPLLRHRSPSFSRASRYPFCAHHFNASLSLRFLPRGPGPGQRQPQLGAVPVRGLQQGRPQRGAKVLPAARGGAPLQGAGLHEGTPCVPCLLLFVHVAPIFFLSWSPPTETLFDTYVGARDVRSRRLCCVD